MGSIVKNWNGRVFGTNTGNVNVTLDGDDSAIKGLIRLNDDAHGIILYDATGKFEDGRLELSGTPHGETPDEVQLGNLTIMGNLAADGQLAGDWASTLGTGGTFILWPHAHNVRAINAGGPPEQLNTATRSLGAIRLYADDVPSLIAHLVKEFSEKRAVVSYIDHGNEKNVYSTDFTSILDTLPQQSYLKMTVQEPELYGLNRGATIELTAHGENTIRVQSVQEAWTIGKAEAISRHMAGYQRKLATQFRKFGLTVNLLITVAVLAALPGLPTFWQRLAFCGCGFAVQALVAQFHRRYVPNFLLLPAQKKPGWVGRLGPAAISWAITTLGAVVAAIIYGLLKGELANSPLLKALGVLGK